MTSIALPLGRERLAENIMHFTRVLRMAGLPVGPAKVIAAIDAVEAVGIANREDFRAALESVLIERHDQQTLFEQAFELFWRNPRLLERMMQLLLPKIYGRAPRDASEAPLPARLAEALAPASDRSAAEREQREVELDAALSFSPREVLQSKDFESMSVDELAQVKAMIARLRLPLPELVTRRTRPADRGVEVDLRASLRAMASARGVVVPLAWRERRRRHPPLVVLCDISGSMDRYSRMLLLFLHAITNDQDRVHVLLFGTRLTNITRHLKQRDVDVAIARVSVAVSDWAGGTRIGACLSEFNRRWSRRLLAQGAIVLLISDGLDSDVGEGLAKEMERLHKSCRRLIWLNPLLRYAGFEARPAGIRAMLPYVDEFLPVHNLRSLKQLAHAFAHRMLLRGRAMPLATKAASWR
ncbi:MAG: VWA domain-containing protein [Betaproteobacteria bacterium]|nr:MAG: VWA domain-containing protein [Betaproteobacteria bacterium]